jgi:hypothetical protein
MTKAEMIETLTAELIALEYADGDWTQADLDRQAEIYRQLTALEA